MKYFTAFTTVALYIVAVSWYCYLVTIGEIQTVLMTWLLFLATVVAGFISYVKSAGQRHWLQNVCNVADVVVIIAVVCFLLVYDADVGVKVFDLWCFAGWAVIVIWWVVGNDSMKANVAFNVLLVVAYIPLIRHLLTVTQHGESYITWGMIFLAGFVGLYNPIKKRDHLGIIYASRSIISTGVVLLLMCWIDFQ